MEGEIVISTKSSSTRLEKSDAYLIPGHKTYTMKCTKPCKLFFIHFSYQLEDGSDFSDIFENCVLLPKKLFNFIKEDQSTNFTEVYDIINIKGIVYNVFAELAKENKIDFDEAVLNYSETILKALTYINDNLSATLTIKEIADSLNYSADYLSNKFYDECNVNLKKHISTLLYKKSLLLLSSGIYLVKEVASQLKFSDQYYFSRFFKKYHLSSPKSYQINRRKS
jgi:AraC-like DNA-binding protein